MPQIFDVTANENARYKPNELECNVNILKLSYDNCYIIIYQAVYFK